MPDNDGAAHSPPLDCDVCRRDVLRGLGAAGATAAIASTPGLAQDNTSDGENINYLSTGASIGLAPGLSALSYFSNGSFDWISAWGDQSESEFKQKYEYEQRIDIYQEAYNFEQFTKRQLASIESSANSLSRWIVGHALKEVYRQAEEGADLSTAISEGQAVVDAEFVKIFNKLVDHWEQVAIAVKGWYNLLDTLSEPDVAAPIGYTMTRYDPFTGMVNQIKHKWGWNDPPNTPSVSFLGETRNPQQIMKVPNNGVEQNDLYASICLPKDLTQPGKNTASETTDPYETYVQQFHWEEIMNRVNSGFTYEEDGDDPDNQTSITLPNDTYSSYKVDGAVRIMPPAPVDFDVNPEDVEDVSDNPYAKLLMVSRYARVIQTIADTYTNAADTVETWCNSNYSDLKANTDQYDIEDMSTAPALQDAAENAENPAEAALMMHSLEIPTNLDNDVRLQFPNVTDENGNPVQASGYLGVTNPPSDGLPVGEVIDPTAHDGEIYFAHNIADVPIAGVEDTGGNTTDGNTTDNTTDGNTTDGSTETTAQATYTQLTAKFEIIDTADGGDSVQFNARETVQADYDWQTVVEILEENNQARNDASEQTMETDPDSSGGPIIPDDFDLGTGSPLAGLAIIGGAIVAVGAAVTNLLPGN
ncbi:hypothetical protein [Natronoarchaeum rubrum]|uniref:hypothetical protein n=1 Tax=Natronoarchaeum rubrum TaxID=755311 RepID=UPI0021125390|nr:hypothetical protein [Natronoarchaeum rubrum]